MIRTSLRLTLVTALVGLGWMAAKAQTAQPTFEIVVEAPAGETTIRCERGCELAWVQRGVNPNATPMQSFTFSCGGGGALRCGSGRVGGWIKP